jgi:glutathione peroxidase-family protein
VKIVDISVTVTFAPEKTNVEKLIKALKTKGFDVTGIPKFLK